MSQSTTPVVRILTSHTTSSSSEPGVIIQRSEQPLQNLLGDTVKGANIWATDIHPPINPFKHTTDDADLSGGSLVIPNGTNVRVTDMAPNSYAGMHRTSSIDYNIFISGTAWLETPSPDDPLDSNKVVKTLVKAGDIVVQRGTNHAWRAGPEGCRWAAVLVAALPVVDPSTGKALEDVQLS
jgi:hypothetical protein